VGRGEPSRHRLVRNATAVPSNWLIGAIFQVPSNCQDGTRNDWHEGEAQRRRVTSDHELPREGHNRHCCFVPEANLPEDSAVRVEPILTETPAARLKAVIGVVYEMPFDWAVYHDYYVISVSKK
jgi:hypothetical protein